MAAITGLGEGMSVIVEGRPVVALTENFVGEGGTPRVISTNSFIHLAHNVLTSYPSNAPEEGSIEPPFVKNSIINHILGCLVSQFSGLIFVCRQGSVGYVFLNWGCPKVRLFNLNI